MNKKTMDLCISGISIAIYVVVLYFTQSISFGQYQIRLATSMYSMVYIFEFLCIPLGIANMLSNLCFGALGLLDMIGGFVVGIVTTRLICIMRKIHRNPMFCCLPIAVIPTIVVPIWLHYILGIEYIVLVIHMIPGQIVASIIGGTIIIPAIQWINKTIITND